MKLPDKNLLKNIGISMDTLMKNRNGGWYSLGKEKTSDQKRQYEDIYMDLKVKIGKDPSVRIFAKEAKISVGYSQKIIKEIKSNGSVVTVEKLKSDRIKARKKGVGSICLTEVDVAVLLQLRDMNPLQSNQNYVNRLAALTGTKISSRFITTLFKKIGPYSGKFKKPAIIPIDKFKPSNIKTYEDYLNFVSQIPAHKLHFLDEKLLKGEELYSEI